MYIIIIVVVIIIIIIIIIITAVQPFFGPWPLFSFLIIYTVGRSPWTGDQPVARPLPTQNKRIQYKHPCLESDSNPRSQRSSEDSS
jgi:hypothetical protein